VLDGDPLGDEVLADHVDEGLALLVLRRARLVSPVGVEVGLAAELVDALGDEVHVLLSSFACWANSSFTDSLAMPDAATAWNL
jgi:hypothetical protein